MLKLIFLILYGSFCIWFAEANHVWIDKQKKIKHFWNGLIHGVSALIALYFFDWKAALSILLIARIVFDVSLNIFRGLGIDYVSPNPKSLIDRLEKYLFKQDGITPKILYLAILICLQIV